MRWYPWSWFSDLVFIGAGGFSAVYTANVLLPYDIPANDGRFSVQKRRIALKVVDEKILNEVKYSSSLFFSMF